MARHDRQRPPGLPCLSCLLLLVLVALCDGHPQRRHPLLPPAARLHSLRHPRSYRGRRVDLFPLSPALPPPRGLLLNAPLFPPALPLPRNKRSLPQLDPDSVSELHGMSANVLAPFPKIRREIRQTSYLASPPSKLPTMSPLLPDMVNSIQQDDFHYAKQGAGMCPLKRMVKPGFKIRADVSNNIKLRKGNIRELPPKTRLVTRTRGGPVVYIMSPGSKAEFSGEPLGEVIIMRGPDEP